MAVGFRVNVMNEGHGFSSRTTRHADSLGL
jgi:hypothetical protein